MPDIGSLLASATTALDTNDHHEAAMCIRRAAALLGIDLGPTLHYLHAQGGLAPWQVRRIASFIEENLVSNMRVTDLAELVRLSQSHFFRAFRRSFGETPVAYIMKRRIVRAQGLMLSSERPLAEIALECGMCDQSHFTHVFRRIVGMTPQLWRRWLFVRKGA